MKCQGCDLKGFQVQHKMGLQFLSRAGQNEREKWIHEGLSRWRIKLISVACFSVKDGATSKPFLTISMMHVSSPLQTFANRNNPESAGDPI